MSPAGAQHQKAVSIRRHVEGSDQARVASGWKKHDRFRDTGRAALVGGKSQLDLHLVTARQPLLIAPAVRPSGPKFQPRASRADA